MAEHDVNTINGILTAIAEELNEARGVPFSKTMCFIDREKLFDLVDEALDNLPGDITAAQALINSKQKILTDANTQAERIVSEANARAERILADAREMANRMVEESQIVTAANKRAREIYAENEAKVKTLNANAIQYVTEKLTSAHNALEATLKEVDSVRRNIRTERKEVTVEEGK
ncbi:MAG: hypothetical protein IKU11_07925 [Clostridia bacterium]|nr:hypothetical protein [Clostridia bacterium]